MEREIEVEEIECPFCGNKDLLKTKDEVSDGGEFCEGEFSDAWDCTCCGERTELELDFWVREAKEFKYYVDNGDWDGLLRFCSNERFDEVTIASLAKYYLQNKEWDKAWKIAEIMLKINPGDVDGQALIERIKQKDCKIKINVTANQLIDAFQWCNTSQLYYLDLTRKELVSYAPDLDANEEESVKREVENNSPNFLKIPLQDPAESFHLMENFIHEIGEHQGQTEAAGVLSEAIERTKPFQNFKEALLNYPKIREQWFRFEREVYKEMALDWVCGNNLICKKGEK